MNLWNGDLPQSEARCGGQFTVVLGCEVKYGKTMTLWNAVNVGSKQRKRIPCFQG